MDEIQANLDTMISLITQVDDNSLVHDLAVTLQRLHMANQAYIKVMYEVLTAEQ